MINTNVITNTFVTFINTNVVTNNYTNTITAAGVVTREADIDIDGYLTATLSKGSVSIKEYIQVSVRGINVDDIEAVFDAYNALQIGFAGDNNAYRVTTDVTLPTSGFNGVSIAWSVWPPNATNVITTNGVVTRMTNNDSYVWLMATLSKGNITNYRQYLLTVPRHQA